MIRKTLTRAAIGLTALAATASAASAQTLVSAGDVMDGELTASDRKFSSSSKPYDCYFLSTEPGSQWRITMESAVVNSYLNLGRGGCGGDYVNDTENDSLHIGFWSADPNSRITFGAGGGVYVILASAPWNDGGAYRLRVERLPGVAANTLPAGGVSGPWLDPAWVPETASTSPEADGDDLATGTIFQDCEAVCPEMVVLPAGSFMMGSPNDEADRESNEGPRHAVAFAHPFAVARYEVTFAEYDACVEAGGCTRRPGDFGWGRGRRPVVDVNWNDAQAYVAWLSRQTGRRYHLPSEAEWEYAARAGRSTPWHTGAAILSEDANILNQFEKTVAVGAYPPNAFGLHDMHGNVWEWTLDCLDTGYIGVPADGSAATGGDCTSKRILRGGGYNSEPGSVRSATRGVGASATRYRSGFRVARSL